MSTIKIENFISEKASEIRPEMRTADPVIIAENLGIKYVIGNKWESLQSWVFNLLLQKVLFVLLAVNKNCQA